MRDDVVYKQDGEHAFLFDPKNGNLLHINETGAFIWRELRAHGSYPTLISNFNKQYDLGANQHAFLQDLHAFTGLLADQDYMGEDERFFLIDEVFLAVTDFCNLACKHCNVWSSRNQSEISLEQLETIIGQISQYPVNTITISGGEALAHRQIHDVLARLDQLDIGYSINTNGTLLSPARLERMQSLKNLNGFLVGLDGADAISLQQLRVRGNLAKTVDGIKNIRTFLPNARINLFVVVNRHNQAELERIADLALANDVDGIQFEPFLPMGHGKDHEADLRVSQKDWHQAYQTVHRLHEKHGDKIQGNYVTMYDYFEGMLSKGKAELQKGAGCYRACSAGLTKITIKPNGEVTPCDRLWDFTAGSIFETPLMDIVQLHPNMKLLRTRPQVSMENDPHCAKCGYEKVCGGGCPAVPYYQEGTLFKHDFLSCIKNYEAASRAT